MRIRSRWIFLNLTILVESLSVFIVSDAATSTSGSVSDLKKDIISADIPNNGTLLGKKQSLSIARNQTKRQADRALSGRAGDPWFLDSEPYPAQPYRFVYNVKGKNGLTEQYRQEVGDGKFLTGSYGYVLPDGIYRHVDYVADDRGFRAFIRTSEPGTANQNPADVVINSNPVPQQPYATFPTASSFTNPSPSQWIGSSPGSLPPSSSVSFDRGTGNNIPTTSSFANNFTTDFFSAGYTTDPVTGLLRRPPGSIVGTQLLRTPNTTYNNLLPINDLSKASWLSSSRWPSTDLGVPAPRQDGNRDDNRWDSNRSSLAGQPVSSFGSTSEPNQQPRNPELPTWHSSQLDLPLLPASRYLARPLSDLSTNTSPRPPTGTYKLAYDRLGGELRPLEPNAPKINYDHLLRPTLQQTPKLVSPLLSPFGSLSDDSSPYQLVNRSSNLRNPSSVVEQQTGGASLHYIPIISNQMFSVSHTTSVNNGEEQRRSSSRSFKTKGGEISELSNKEHESGTQYGSVKSHTEQSGVGGNEQQHQNVGLIPPPAPQFEPSHPLRHQDDLTSPHHPQGGVKTLQAPYSQLSLPDPPSPPEEPPRLIGKSLFANNRGSVKGGTFSDANWPVTPAPLAPIRTVRMPEKPEDLRSSMLMHDWRSMQNAIGLPQPPRGLQQFLNSGQPGNAENSYLSRALRVDALLANRGAGQASSPAAALSTPDASTTTTTTQPPALNQQQQPPEERRPLSTGPLVRLGASTTEVEELDRHFSALNGNETLTFDARRLTSRSTTERPSSELEKFQQRLKAQQLLLEQTKQPIQNINSNRFTPSAPTTLIVSPNSSSTNSNTSRIKSANSSNAENSHVSYDEEPENNSANTISGSSDARTTKPRSSSSFGSGYKWLEIGKARESKNPELETESDRSLHSSAHSLKQQSPSASTTSTSQSKSERLSEFARTLQNWPSLSANGQQQNSTNSLNKPGASSLEGNTVETEGATSTPKNISTSASRSRGNTINLDFINSVTALSVDDINPFAIASVNPALQAASKQQDLAQQSGRLLQFHKLSDQPAQLNTPTLATSSARYFSSPELLAALAYHERRDTSSQLRDLIGGHESSTTHVSPSEGVGVSATRRDGWASNHRFAVAPSSNVVSAPYMLSAAASASQSSRIEPTIDDNMKSNRLMVKRAESGNGRALEVRDRKLHLDNHQFYEVLASPRHQPLESSASFTAFRDAELSIPALV